MKGICFTENMFNAVIDGRKTQTRRLIKLKQDHEVLFSWFNEELDCYCLETKKAIIYKPRYKSGEKVYIKEPYWTGHDHDTGKENVVYKYGATYIPENVVKKMNWKSPRFMPERYARYFIEITSVRCERVQNILYTDARKEGIKMRVAATHPYEMIYQIPEMPNYYDTYRQAYAAMFDSIYGKGNWDSNPYVFVYNFKLLK